MLSPEYSAGFFDGEGTVHVRVQRKEDRIGARYDYYGIRVSISNTNRAVIDAFYTTWGGFVTTCGKPCKPNHKPAWRWECQAKQIVKFLTTITPYLIVKKEVAQKALELQGLYKMGGKFRTVSDSEIEKRERLYREIRYLNQRGINGGL